MKDIYKNQIFYYILIAIAVALWPLLIWGKYLPDAEHSRDQEKHDYKQARGTMVEILNLAPERVELVGPKGKSPEFDYATVVAKVATDCGIRSTDYKLTSRPIIATHGRKSRSARVVLKQINVERFAKFLSAIQLGWPTLECTQVKLTGNKDLKDIWDIDIDFKYHY